LKVTKDFQSFNALSNFDKLYNKRIDWKPVVIAANVAVSSVSKTPQQQQIPPPSLSSQAQMSSNPNMRSPQLLKGGAQQILKPAATPARNNRNESSID